MESYLAKILDLENQEDKAKKLTDKQTREMLQEKLKGGGKKRRKKDRTDKTAGMTAEELLAEQQKLFDNAKNFQYEQEALEIEEEDEGHHSDGQQITSKVPLGGHPLLSGTELVKAVQSMPPVFGQTSHHALL